jgi:type III pantothenate kinase
MLLAIDVGNSTTEFGVFEAGKILFRWRIVTQNRTGDELCLIVANHCGSRGLTLSGDCDCVICSVVPPLTQGFADMAAALFRKAPLIVDSSLDTGLRILYRDHLSVGSDRLATAAGAVERFGRPVIVVDMGTATTFDVVSESGDYVGGAIAPGVGTAAEELFRRAARLPRVELKRPQSVIGQSTEESLQAGIVFGAAAAVDGILERIFEELGARPPVVATGGYSSLIVPQCKYITHVDDALVLEGLRVIFERHRTSGRGKRRRK